MLRLTCYPAEGMAFVNDVERALVADRCEFRAIIYLPSRRNFSIGRFNDRPRCRMSAHTSPMLATRSGIFLSVNVPGVTSPRSSSAHVHGADTGAPRFARTV